MEWLWIQLSDKWLRKNVFTPEQILKQMDLHEGALNYEAISTPSCFKRVAKKLEAAANEICPFHSYMTPFV
jgi:hypothetical protein